MKKLLYLLIILLAFSCAPKKIITATKTEAKTETQNAISDKQESQNKAVLTKVEQSDTGTETVIKMTVYAEKKDSLTGKQLIKSETVTTKKKVEKRQVKTDSNSLNSQIVTHEDSSKTVIQTKSDTTTKEIPKAPAIKYWFWIGIFVAVCVGLFFVRKYWTKIKSIFAK